MSSLADRLRWAQPAAVRRVRGAALAARLRMRRLTAGDRSVPDFLIIGAQRAGSTSLYRYLAQHPALRPPLVKEIQFFASSEYPKGLDHYRAYFPRRQATAPIGSAPTTFEATPYYLFHPMAPERIARALPDARVVVLLREPAARAYSHYRHSVQRGYEQLSFEDALNAETERLAGEDERLRTDPGYDSHPYRAFSYFRRGVYVDQLRAWEQHVARERILVVPSEDMYADPAAVYARVLDFVGLEPFDGAEFDVFERSRPGPGADPDTIQALRARYRPHNLRLSEHLGGAFPWPE